MAWVERLHIVHVEYPDWFLGTQPNFLPDVARNIIRSECHHELSGEPMPARLQSAGIQSLGLRWKRLRAVEVRPHM